MLPLFRPSFRLAPWAAAALAVSGCRTHAPLRIGIVLDSDGARGAAFAAADINAAGGVRGRRLELRALQGTAVSTSAKDALAGAETLVSDPAILAVVGHTNSAASLAAAQVYNEHHVVQIAPTTTTPLYSDAGDYSFRLVASDIHQGAFLANLVLADPRERPAVLYVNDDYGRGLHAKFLERMAQGHSRVVYDAPFGEADAFTDADDLARAVARSNPTTLIWLGRSTELTLLLPKLRVHLPALKVIASDGFGGVRSETGEVPPLVGVRYVRLLDLATPTEQVRLLRERYERQWHEPATDQALLSYEGVQLLADAIRAVGPDREAIRQYLSELGTKRPAAPGLGASVSFDRNGDPAPAYYLAEVTAHGSVPVRLAADGRLHP